MPEETCETCKFYKMIKGNPRLNMGECLRYPPTVLYDPDSVTIPVALFPMMCLADWCGEYVPKKPVTLKDLADRRG